MRSVLVLLICGLLVGGVPTSDAAEVNLKPGMIVEHHVRPGWIPVQVALPEGKWEVGTVDEYHYPSGTVDLRAILFQEKDGKLSKIVWFSAPIEKGDVSGWTVNKNCYQDGMHYRKTLAEQAGGDQDCRWIKHYIPKFNTSKSKYARDFAKLLVKKNFKLPQQTIEVGYIIADEFSRVYVKYSFIPESEGFEAYPRTDLEGSPWHPTVVIQDPKKLAYINRLKAWADEFHPKVKAGFKNKLIASTNPAPTAKISPPATNLPLSTTKSSTIAGRLKQLDSLLKQDLISKDEYELKRKDILKSL